MLEKATRVASIAAAEAAKETAKGASSATSLGEQAGRYRVSFLRRRNEVRWYDSTSERYRVVSAVGLVNIPS